MKNYIHFQFILIVLWVTASCCAPKKLPTKDSAPNNGTTEINPTQNHVEPVKDSPSVEIESESKSQLVASFKKSPCFGKCPVFEVKIYKDGTADWKGEKNVERIGRYKAHVPEKWLKQVADEAEARGYFDLMEHYPNSGRNIVDLPITTTFIKSGKKEKKVENNFDAPLNLQEFEKYLYERINDLDWKPVQR